MRYYELAKGNVNHRAYLLEETLLENEIEKNKTTKSELYHSIWLYDEQVKEHMALNKTIKSYRGRKHLPLLIFDIDRAQDTDDFVLTRAREFVKVLYEDWQVMPEELDIYYSGNGYHIHMNDYFKFEPSFVIQVEVRATLSRYFPEADIKPYNAAGLIRAAYSLNIKTNRFKIPLSIDEFNYLSSGEIITLSNSNTIREVAGRMADENKNWSRKVIESPVEREKVQHRDEPTRIVTCMQHLFNKGGSEGSRHEELMRLVSSWRRMGQTKEACIILGKKFAPTLASLEVEKIVNDTYKGGYQFGCRDKVMSSYCDPKCIYYDNKDYTAAIQTNVDIHSMLVNDVKIRRKHKFIDLQKVLALKQSYNIYMGELVVFWGDVKIGKSTLVQNIVAQTPELNYLYMPLENGTTLDSRRFIQIKSGLSKEEVYNIMDEGSYDEQMKLISLINNVKFTETGMTVNSLYKVAEDNNVDAIIVDTVDHLKITNKYGDDPVKTLTIQLRDFTRLTKKLVMVVHHISKHAAIDEDGNSKPLTIHSGLGTSALEQKADKVIGIEGDRNKEPRRVMSLGARDEEYFETMVYFNKNNFRLTTLNGR